MATLVTPRSNTVGQTPRSDTLFGRPQLSIKGLLLCMTAFGFGVSYVRNTIRMRVAERELVLLRQVAGVLDESQPDEIAAVRIGSDEPLTWRTRVRIPNGTPYRLAYSSLWAASTAGPDWFAAQAMPPGESVVTVRVMRDPRDDRWKISAVIQNTSGVSRIGTTLPDELVSVFRGSYDVMSTGVGRQTVIRPAGDSLRILDERYFSGTSLLLSGDDGPREDLVGVYVELQPDIGPLPKPASANNKTP